MGCHMKRKLPFLFIVFLFSTEDLHATKGGGCFKFFSPLRLFVKGGYNTFDDAYESSDSQQKVACDAKPLSEKETVSSFQEAVYNSSGRTGVKARGRVSLAATLGGK